ncbi:MAG: SPOR domain-containing protein [Yoonia sp.]|uniref:SPOR domain-containing protein n=1 Tax=Yoonia sp. TaxID=2212373 RepID=UPI003EFA373F
MAVYEEGFAPSKGVSRPSKLVNYAGAALSLSLIVGVSFWGYKLIMRDVSGIPVVRAMEGDMRVLPDNPGGGVALHTGLAVNEVAAMGETGGPEDRLVLAPTGAGLAPEDLAAQPDAKIDITPVLSAPTEPAAPAATADVDEIALLADQLAAGSAPSVVLQPDAIPASVAGVSTSLRPVGRPAGLRPAAATAPALAATTTPASEVAVTNRVFPEGTHLVQLGAYPNPAMAASAWDSLQARFGSIMGGRERVIQVTNQSSGTWYRLRASGFLDRADARRLCAALQAEGTDCIAVVTN